jgi:hypothetical protein
MGTRSGFQWLIGLFVVAMLAAVGLYTYNIGVAHGIAESGRLVAAPSGAAPPVYLWGPRPWGYGFGFFPFFPFLFIAFWFAVVRGIFWSRGAYHRGYGYRYGGCGGIPPAFDEWHRRAHAQQDAPPSTPSNA